MTSTQFKTRVNLADTIRSIEEGQTIVIKNADFKPCSINTTVCRLRKQGLNLTISEKGQIDSVTVTRLKGKKGVPQ